MKTYEQQSGRSMIEMLGVLAIIGVLSVGGLAGYSKAMMKYRTNKTINQITHMVTRTRVTFIAQKNYAGLGNNIPQTGDVLVHTNIIPKDTIIRNRDGKAVIPYRFKNPFAGRIYVRVGDKTFQGDQSAFIIRYDSIPKQACIEIATKPWGDTDGSGFVMLTINNPIPLEANGSNCESTPIWMMGSAIHCTHSKTMLNAAAAHACREKNNILELMFY